MKYIFLLPLLFSTIFIELIAVPPPAEFTTGKYAEYDVNFTMSNTESLSLNGTVRLEVEERTSSIMKIMVTISFQTPLNVQIKLRYKIDPNTGRVIDIETVQGSGIRVPRELMGLSGSVWVSKDISVGSTFNIGRTIATVIGSESVTAKNGVTYDCWKAEAPIPGFGKAYYYYEKSTGLLIKETISGSTQQFTISFEGILKDTNIVSAPSGILGLLGYINLGGIMIPILLLIVVIVAMIILVVILLKILLRPPPPPPPPPPI